MDSLFLKEVNMVLRSKLKLKDTPVLMLGQNINPVRGKKDEWEIVVKNSLVNSEIKYYLKKVTDEAEYKQDNPSEMARENSFHVFQNDSSDMTPAEFDEMLRDLCESAVSSCESLLNALDSVVKILNDNGLDLYCGQAALSKSGGTLCTTKTIHFETPLVIALKSEEADACIRYALMDNGIMNFDIMELDLSAFAVAIEKIAYILNVMSDKKDSEGSYQYDPIEISSVLASVYKAKNDIEEFLNY